MKTYYSILNSHIFMPAMIGFATVKGLVALEFLTSLHDTLPQEYIFDAAPFKDLQDQLEGYARHQRFVFDLELYQTGTNKQLRVWQALKDIPYGETRSYKDISDQLSSSPLAIGQANKRNKFPIIIPCHRVINHNGDIGGYYGHNNKVYNPLINLKKALLYHETKGLLSAQRSA